MTPERLSAYFNRIADAPGATQYLRLFILDLAMSGRLASSKNGIGIAHWQSVKLADCATVINGRAYKQAELLSAGMPVIRIQNLNGGQSWYYSDLQLGPEKYANPGDLLYAWSGTFGPYIWNGPRGIFHYHIWKLDLSAQADKCFMFYLLHQLTSKIKAEAHGLMLPHMTKEKMENWPVVLPPVDEQRRIVAKVDELMALCARLEAAQAERESRRDRLAAASLQRLNQPADAPAFREHARFHLSHLQRLTTRPEQIKQLRQTILNLAMRGQLIEQDPNNESAAALLLRIEIEKERLALEGDLSKNQPLPVVSKDEAPFAIPSSWSWTRIGTCSLLTEYGTSVKSDHTTDGIPVLKMGDIQDGKVRLGGQKKAPRSIDDLPKLFLKRFDLLYNRTNSAELVGKTGIFLGNDDSYTFASYLIRIRFPNQLINPAYSNLAMNAPYFRETQILPQLQQQCGQANVNGTKLRNMVIPLPPLAEQHRIVAKVDELMALCDRLEAQLTTTQTQSRRLLEAVLHEALAGA